MKNIIIVVLVVLLAIAGYVIAKDRTPDGGVPPPSGGGHPPVQNLSKEAEAALTAQGVKDMAFVAAILQDGSIQLLRPEKTEHQVVTLPQATKAVKGVAPISIVSFEGSTCFMWVEGYISNGMRYDRFCAYWLP